MLAAIANVWWLRLHREIVGLAKQCQQCQVAGRNLKPMLRQKEIGQLPKSTGNNQEIPLDFAGPFQNAINPKSTY